jgi:uncharacterized protein YbaP (TraB family)
MKYRILFLFLSFGFFGLSQTEGVDRSNHQLLWEISGNGLKHPAYLFGTFHNNALELFDQPDSVFYALSQAEAVSLEVDISEVMGDHDIITRSPNSIPTNLRWLVQDGGDVTYTQYGSDAGRPQFIDLYFNQVADQCGKSFFPLETVESQTKLLMRSGRESTGYVSKKTLSLEEMKALYLEGDIEKLHNVTMESTLPYKGLYEDLIVIRNEQMVDGLDTLMHQTKLFCAVGAAHLGGEDGIIPLLRELGYTLRPVTPVFSENRSVFINQIKACEGYVYRDEVYGFKIEMEGRPRVTVEKDGAKNLIYQEMGQGNTYSIYNYHLETMPSLQQFYDQVMSDVKQEDIVEFSVKKLYDGTPYYQLRVKNGYDSEYWMRLFIKNDIGYLMYAQGGLRFMNSKRPFDFFNRIKFLEKEVIPPLELSEYVVSPTQSLKGKLPAQSQLFEKVEDDVSIWRRKSFNPVANETFFLYESVLINEFIYSKSDDIGAYLIQEFDRDSIHFFNENENDDYKERWFFARRMGRSSLGRIRLLGNILHYGQYIGEDSLRGMEFLSFMELNEIPTPANHVTVQKEDFKTVVSKSGFKKIQPTKENKAREFKHFALNDIEHGLTYEVIIKKFKPWAFISRSSIDSVLYHQIGWPERKINHEHEFTITRSDTSCFMDFIIRYLDSKNIFRGRVILDGKNIYHLSLTYPSYLDSAYKDLPFIDSTFFTISNPGIINEIPFREIQKMLDSSAVARSEVRSFFENNVNDEGYALELLRKLNNLSILRSDENRTQSVRTVLFSKLTSEQVTQEVFDFWKSHAVEESPAFVSYGLHLFAGAENGAQFLKDGFTFVEENRLFIDNYPSIIEKLSIYPERYKTIWPLLADGFYKSAPHWHLYVQLDSLMSDDFFKEFVLSNAFKEFSTQATAPFWVKVKYFSLALQAGISPSDLQSLVKTWTPTSAYEKGIRISLLESLGHKIKEKDLKEVREDVFSSIGYVLLKSEFGQVQHPKINLTSNLFSFQESLGLLAYQNFMDEIVLKDHSLELLYDFDYEVNGVSTDFALFRTKENGVVYYFAKTIPSHQALPRDTEYGDGTYFMEFNGYPKKEAVIKKLKELL